MNMLPPIKTKSKLSYLNSRDCYYVLTVRNKAENLLKFIDSTLFFGQKFNGAFKNQ